MSSFQTALSDGNDMVAHDLVDVPPKQLFLYDTTWPFEVDEFKMLQLFISFITLEINPTLIFLLKFAADDVGKEDVLATIRHTSRVGQSGQNRQQ